MFKVKGHSNSNIVLFKDDIGNFLVKKNGEDHDRLLKQKNKQKLFLKKIENDSSLFNLFSSPLILDDGEFIMQFCEGDSIADIIEYKKPKDIDIILQKIRYFLIWEMTNVKIEKIHSSIFIDKLLNINIDNSLKNDFISILKKENYFEIPIGFCHGDFTFSNMIFSDKIILIDFLDCYIESPLQDLSKLLQEINLHWTLNMMNGSRDMVKLKIGYEYIHRKTMKIIDHICNCYSINQKLLNIFYIITLFRIFPYIKDRLIYNLVHNELSRRIYDFIRDDRTNQ